MSLDFKTQRKELMASIQLEQETQALASDMNVRAAKRAIDQAQAKLTQEQQAKDDLPLDPRWHYWNHENRANAQTWAWERVSDAESALKAAQKGYDAALSSHARSLRESEKQAQEKLAQEKFEAEQSVRAIAEEAAAKILFKSAYLESGGTSSDFEKAWSSPGGLWEQEKNRRTLHAVAIKQAMQEQGYHL